MTVEAFYGVMIPFLGTSLGSACVLFMRNKLKHMLQRALTGFAAGVMVAASVWSLLILIFNRNQTKAAGGAFLIKEVPTQEYADISRRADAE